MHRRMSRQDTASQSRVPRYLQIAQTLRGRIALGNPAPGPPLETQRPLAEGFGVTLMTLRQALDLLERDGLITRRHGLGTFVTSPTVDYDILHLRAFAGDLAARGEHVVTRFLRSHFAAADRSASRALGLGERRQVFVLERLRLVDGRPIGFQVSHLPAAIGADLAHVDLTATSLRDALAFKLGIDITAARETVAAVSLERRAARELGCRPGVPAFRSERVSVRSDG